MEQDDDYDEEFHQELVGESTSAATQDALGNWTEVAELLPPVDGEKAWPVI
jgi:hypothetical protein